MKDCAAPASASPFSVKPTPIDDTCWHTDSPEPLAWMPYRTLLPDGTVEQGYAERPVIDALHGPTGNKEPLISFAAASPAKTSASPDAAPDSPASGAASFSSSHESLTLFSPLADGASLKTFPDFFPQTVAEISPSYSRRWPSSGFTTSPGECWTADTMESPNDGGVSTSLRDVLEASVPARYYLSQRAAAGILRRAEKRGRELPQHLADALRLVSTTREAAS